MQSTNYVKALAGPAIVVVLLVIGWQTRDAWKGWLIASKNAKGDEEKDDSPDKPKGVTLSEQAQKNLRLISKPARVTAYQRKIHLPGAVVDRPGHSDRGIPAPIAGVVTNVYAIPGKTVRAGDELFRLRLASDSFQTSQMELYKSVGELEIVREKRKRLESVPPGAIPPSTLLELQYQEDRLKVLIKVYRQDLLTRQLTGEQIANIEKGQLVSEMVVRMPARLGKHHQHGDDPVPVPSAIPGAGKQPNAGGLLPMPPVQPIEYEVQELKVNLGDHVQAGQILAYLADHRFLYLEGRALKQEATLLARAAKEGWPVEAEFTEPDDDAPGERLTGLSVEFLGPTMDASGLTLPVYVLFANPHREYVRQGVTYRVGTYRPGQKVLLKVTVAHMPGVFVLPHAAVVREGAEAYVFRQNGNAFDRRAVHVILEDTDVVVIENDGSIVPGNYITHNGAAALNRALKASQAEGGGHSHDHD